MVDVLEEMKVSVKIAHPNETKRDRSGED